PDSGRGLKVYLCRHCGLMQSLPRLDRAPRRSAQVSSGADWGNVRYGKRFRTEACLALIRKRADLSKPLHALDVGSNRGSFAQAFLGEASVARIACVEPDERVADSCARLERAELVRARIEDATFPDECFDVIHSCHTIEHLKSPRAVLADHWRTLKPGGLLVIDAPNVGLISSPDIIEEWFIDKHLYHFSGATLSRLLDAAGFEVIDGPSVSNSENLLFAARKRGVAAQPVRSDAREVEGTLKHIDRYVANRTRNRAALGEVAREIAALADKRVALWGAGRLFDALVLHGGFDPRTLSLLVDTHLKPHMNARHGVALSGPEALAAANAGVIVVMSRAFAGEIAKIAKLAAPKAEILFYADLIARARTKIAA
ncbi:MAG TPA: class I SAM-dependent methyltransferase, partial [Candidatus Cybelea sp.]|nr:class I SAM-dependent methyltransferase [Candidatus Cybelea sp.]